MSAAALDCYAVTPPGVEQVTARELAALGFSPGALEPGGVAFSADLAGVARGNLHLRTASRVLVRLGCFRARTFAELERHAARLPWDRFAAEGRPVRFRVTSRKSKLYHQDAIAERLLGAAGRPAAERSARTGADDPRAPQEFVVRVFRDGVTVSADSSGELLHRRGYRFEGGAAPLRETLAAAMLLGAGWDPATPLMDPFCGSGTIPIEAALLARRIPPGLCRGFAFERWPELDARVWEREIERAREGILPRAPAPILGADRDPTAVAAARANAERAGVAGDVEVRRAPVSALAPPPGTGWIVTNPPYGVRAGEPARLPRLYASFGRVLRDRCAGWQVALLSSDRRLAARLGLALDSGLLTTNGGIRVRLLMGQVGPL